MFVHIGSKYDFLKRAILNCSKTVVAKDSVFTRAIWLKSCAILVQRL